MRKLITVAVALALSACGVTTGTTTGGIVPTSPAPLAQTTIDDTALDTAWRSFDLALDAINLLTDAGKITVGSPRALQIASAIRKVTAALNAAESFAAAGSTASYIDALREAKAGVSELRILLK